VSNAEALGCVDILGIQGRFFMVNRKLFGGIPKEGSYICYIRAWSFANANFNKHRGAWKVV
jgi:hypothetical protein